MPVTSCGLGISEMIEVELKNFGANPQSLIPFKFSVNGVDGGVPIPTDGFFTGIISKDSSTTIQFETPTDLMNTGIYEIIAIILIPILAVGRLAQKVKIVAGNMVFLMEDS